MSVLVKNITEHKRAEEERDRILTVSHDLICIAGMDGYFKYLNPAWERTLGYTREELLSRPFLAFIHPDDHGKNDAEVEKLTAGQPTIDFENRYIHQDGSFRYISWTATPMPEKHVIYCIGRDITERKQAEQALQEYSERLEGMVETRTRELQEAQEQLLRQEKLAALGQLAGSVAHELRHPLGVLSNAAYFLNMSLPDAGETTREYLEMMAAEIRKADKIISDLLDFSRHQGHSPGDRTEVRLAELMAETLAEQPPPDGIDVVNKIDAEGPPVLVDVQQIKQVLANLIVNAYQAMPDGGTLSVGSRQPAAGSPEHCVLITVRDTGCGIPPENLEKLFEPLFTTKPKGIGLGLAVCRNLVKANGGAISVESEEGVGSTFSMSLPVVKQEETV